ncbi:phosphoketolase [Izhakiella australiensis]|uniref:Probable phosphoketolase n=1 Tax=Izhakiella australiensis TaxID=1926881 RepID=A0A1S8YQR3_9GAMM|nr:phosphoketolase family protein [Izhakiella australiensis]OON41107.1 phosphoketolase [Izhakiella australiensis]
MSACLTDDELASLNAYWQAANYLSVGQIYLMDNPLLRHPLSATDVKPRLLGHWGTTPGLNFVYTHLNRMICQHNTDVLFVCGPGHGGPAMVAQSWLEGSYSEIYPRVTRDEDGMRELFRQFSFPGGIPSHAAAETPGSIHEGGELGYSLPHAFGAAFDNPGLIVACVIGDGEAETGPLASAWQGIKFLNPQRDGAVLPILHLNDYKIASPTLLARSSDDDLMQLFRSQGWLPMVVSGDDPEDMHRQMATAMDSAFSTIRALQHQYRQKTPPDTLVRWPMLLLRSPKGWTGPRWVDDVKVEGLWRAHQVPLSACRENTQHRLQLQKWMKSYQPEKLFNQQGQPCDYLQTLVPRGDKRMGATPYANGGRLRQALKMPDFADYAVEVPAPGVEKAQATAVLGRLLAEIIRHNPDNFRLFAPDETESNRLGAVFDVTDRCWMGTITPDDRQLSSQGRVMEILSEHQCQGWLEGYLLSGRHGLFNCYEAFIHIIDSMFNQHAKWLKTSRLLSWRQPIASLNYLLASHVWQQDHNGYSHQDPGFIDHVVNKKADIVRVYLPPDANTLLWVSDHCLKSWDRINVIIAGKQPADQWLTMQAAVSHCQQGIGIWHWAGNERDNIEPDIVMACAGDVPTRETLAAVDWLRLAQPELRIRVVNVVDLLALQPRHKHPHGKPEQEFEALFTRDRPVIFAFHGYPGLIHRLISPRANQSRFHVHGFNEEGTTTTPFDMTVINRLDRFHLALDAIQRLALPPERQKYLSAELEDKLTAHYRYVREYGDDLPEVKNWRWNGREK